MRTLNKEASIGETCRINTDKKVSKLIMSLSLMSQPLNTPMDFSEVPLDSTKSSSNIKMRKCSFIAQQVFLVAQHSCSYTWLYLSKTKDGDLLKISTTIRKMSIDGKMQTKRSLSTSLRADKVESCNRSSTCFGSRNKRGKRRKMRA